MNAKRGLRILTFFFIVIALLLYLVPLSYTLITSLKTPQQFLLDPVGIVFKPTLLNFEHAWKDADFSAYIFNSLLYAALSTCASLLFALLIAFPVARKYVRHSNLIYTIMMMGMFLPDGTIPLFQIMLKTHLYNTRAGYIISTLSIGGVAFMFFVSFIQGLPKELDEAASIDGCGYFQYFFQILVPLSSPAIASMAILTVIGVWNDIVKSVVFLSTNSLFPITRGLYVFSGQYSTSWTELTAALIIVSIPLTVLYLFLQKYIISGLTAGSVKM